MKNVYDQVMDQVVDSVYDQVRDQIWVQVTENIDDHLWKRVWMEEKNVRWRAAPLGGLVADDCYSFVWLCGMMNPNVMTACTPKERGVFGTIFSDHL